jgi:hypothetical protein
MVIRLRSFAVLVILTMMGGCSSLHLPTLSAASPPIETGSSTPAIGVTPIESSTSVQGTPSEVYALVARGALNCWFGADGPLSKSHIFHANAAPPAQGGAADIALHERDPTASDPRGVRAFRITFDAAAGGVRVSAASLKIPAPMSELMTRDVEVWAKGGAGCQARSVQPPGATGRSAQNGDVAAVPR